MLKYIINKTNILNKEFYLRSPEIVAKELLGKILVKKTDKEILSGMIVETEAYLSKNDQASHSATGLSNRNKMMFEQGGILYVYKIYGIHHCINVVTEDNGIGSAVLIRAIEPIDGINSMKILRNTSEINNLTNGPGKVSQAFDFNLIDNGKSLESDEISIYDNERISESEIITTKKIGITKSVDLPLRFYLKSNSFVSKK
jgi:DNA-3-methyladenine glycosylase